MMPKSEVEEQVSKDAGGYFTFYSRAVAWPGCGFLAKTTRIKIRNVVKPDRNEAQLEIMVTEVTAKQVRGKHADMILNPQARLNFALALLEGTPYATAIKALHEKLIG